MNDSEQPVKKVVKKKAKEPTKKAEEPKWEDLFWTLAHTSEHLLRSLSKREDVPDDARDIIKAVLCLRETKEMFFADNNRLSAECALFWSDTLKQYNLDMTKKLNN